MKYCFLLALILINVVTQASANLLVSPTRVVFEGKDRTKDIVLINTTNQERSYRVEWTEKTVNNRGKYIDIKEQESSSAASEYIRFSPRQVTLKPGERQVVKFMLRRNNSMQKPEYRSHILFTALPLRVSESQDSQQGVSIKLNVLTSYSVPIMIRTIDPDGSISIDNINISRNKNDAPIIQVAFSKTGSSSKTGNVNIYFQASGSGEEKKVGILNGVNFFHEASVLQLELPWLDYAGPVNGTLRAEYVGRDEFIGIVFDELSQTIAVSDF